VKLSIGLAFGLLFGLTVGLVLSHRGSQVATAESVPSGNGDVNGDGTIDMADAIYLIHYLHVHGPAPVPIVCAPCDSCCPPCPSPRLPATGQTTCYDTAGNIIDCVSADYPGQDAFYQAGCPTVGRFIDNGDGTVTDNCTGLMWQKETAPGMHTWQQALQYCEGLTFAGHDDWRLPNVRELGSIIDYSRFDPSIDPVFGAESFWYWSSSTDIHQPYDAWIVHSQTGGVGDVDKEDYNAYVRAVRG